MSRVVGWVCRGNLWYLASRKSFDCERGRDKAHVFTTLAEARKRAAECNITKRVFRLVRRPKVKPGTIAYVVRDMSDESPGSMYLNSDASWTNRHRFGTRAAAEKAMAKKVQVLPSYGPKLKILAVVRKPWPEKPGTVGYRVKCASKMYYLDRVACEGGRPWFIMGSKGTLFLTKAAAREALKAHPNRVTGTIVRISLKRKPYKLDAF